jgi:hypothetical protein
MRVTGAILVGDFAMAFFTSQPPGNTLELRFYNTDWESCLRSWFSLFDRYSMLSECNFSIVGFVDEKVRSSYTNLSKQQSTALASTTCK